MFVFFSAHVNLGSNEDNKKAPAYIYIYIIIEHVRVCVAGRGGIRSCMGWTLCVLLPARRTTFALMV